MPARGPKLVGLNTWPWIWSSALYSSTEPHLCPAAHEYNIRAAYAEHRRAGTWRRVDTWSANTYSVPNSVRIAEFGIGRGRRRARTHRGCARARRKSLALSSAPPAGAPRRCAPARRTVLRGRGPAPPTATGRLRERAAERGSDLRGCVNKPAARRALAPGGPLSRCGRHIGDTAYGRAARRASE